MFVKISNLPANCKIDCIIIARAIFDMDLFDAKNFVDKASNNYVNNISIEGETKRTQSWIVRFIKGFGVIDDIYWNCRNMPQVNISFGNKSNKIKSKGKQVFNIPNTPEGRKFLEQLPTFLNTAVYTRKSRGRGKRDGTYNGSLSLSINDPNCEWIAVYINPKDDQSTKRIQELENQLQATEAY
jgi:hypothetical protein